MQLNVYIVKQLCFRTTPFENLFAESGLLSLEFRIKKMKLKLFKKLRSSNNFVIDDDIKGHFTSTRTHKYTSAIQESI